MLLNCGVGEDSWESLGLQGDPTSPSERKSVLNIYWKDWSWNSNTLATWCKELTHWRRPRLWERLMVGGEGDVRGWMASLTQWTWVWVNSGSWQWTGRPGVLQSVGLQRVGHDWATRLYWTPEDLPDPGIGLASPVSPALQVDSLPSEPEGKPQEREGFLNLEVVSQKRFLDCDWEWGKEKKRWQVNKTIRPTYILLLANCDDVSFITSVSLSLASTAKQNCPDTKRERPRFIDR